MSQLDFQPSGTNSPQLAIFAAAEPAERQPTLSVSVGEGPALARSTDPQTSHDAARRAALFAGSQKTRILLALEALGSATAKELSAETGLSVVQIDRRRHELVAAGKVRLLTHNGLPVDLGGRLLERDGFNIMARTAA